MKSSDNVSPGNLEEEERLTPVLAALLKPSKE
jgi:hypothetical protein